MSKRFLDFAPLWRREITVAQLVAGLTRDDLRDLTNAMKAQHGSAMSW